jgi:hypothetical protein
MISFLFTLSINYAHGAPIFSLNYPTGWFIQEKPYGYDIKSPNGQFQYLINIYPNEYIASVFSTTDPVAIANKLLRADKVTSKGLILEPLTWKNGVHTQYLHTEYSLGGVTRMLDVVPSKSVLYIFIVTYNPASFDHYSKYMKSLTSSISVDVTKLPEKQRITSNTNQPRSDTLGLGTTFGGTGNAVDTWAKGMNNLGKPTDLQQHYIDQRKCFDMKRLGC